MERSLGCSEYSGGSSRYRPDPHGESQESYKGFWRFRGEHVREIRPGSKVHSSVWVRRAEPSNDYAPANLPDEARVVTVD